MPCTCSVDIFQSTPASRFFKHGSYVPSFVWFQFSTIYDIAVWTGSVQILTSSKTTQVWGCLAVQKLTSVSSSSYHDSQMTPLKRQVSSCSFYMKKIGHTTFYYRKQTHWTTLSKIYCLQIKQFTCSNECCNSGWSWKIYWMVHTAGGLIAWCINSKENLINIQHSPQLMSFHQSM